MLTFDCNQREVFEMISADLKFWKLQEAHAPGSDQRCYCQSLRFPHLYKGGCVMMSHNGRRLREKSAALVTQQCVLNCVKQQEQVLSRLSCIQNLTRARFYRSAAPDPRYSCFSAISQKKICEPFNPISKVKIFPGSSGSN